MSDENRRQLISDGIAFMRSISDQYGTETGLQLWDRICEVLDPNVKGEIFIAMLTGDTRAKLTISCSSVQFSTNRIPHIKAIREVTGLGLKEAKDLSDLMFNGQPVSITVKEGLSRQYARDFLRDAGLIV
jgi:hypothetical protein